MWICQASFEPSEPKPVCVFVDFGSPPLQKRKVLTDWLVTKDYGIDGNSCTKDYLPSI